MMVLMVRRGDFILVSFMIGAPGAAPAEVTSGRGGGGGGVTVLYQDTGDICIAVSVSVSEMSHPCSLINSISANQFHA